MILIIDSGATKALWVAGDAGGAELGRWQTPGMSPYYLSDEQLREHAEELRRQLDQLPEALHFYGTGCKALESQRRLRAVLSAVFPEAREVTVETDILGAARAACGRTAGVCAILGTGSNACYYDGLGIADTAGGLGFILGDEGSGASMGKALMSAYLGRRMPEALQQSLEVQYELSRDAIIEAVYRGPTPSRYLAGFAPFIHGHLQHPFVEKLVEKEFGAFCEKTLLVMDFARRLPVHFIGSIAFYFRPLVEKAVHAAGLEPATFHADPVKGLLTYHKSRDL